MKHRRCVILPAADRDIIEIAGYIAQFNLTAAVRFKTNVVRSLLLLCHMPGIGSEYPIRNKRLAGLRKWAVKGFRKILMFYVVSDDLIRVVRVIHGARDIPRILEGE